MKAEGEELTASSVNAVIAGMLKAGPGNLLNTSLLPVRSTEMDSSMKYFRTPALSENVPRILHLASICIFSDCPWSRKCLINLAGVSCSVSPKPKMM